MNHLLRNGLCLLLSLAMLAPGVASMALTLAGTLLHDEVWQGKIRLAGSVVVPVGVTLTIRPGTVIEYRRSKMAGPIQVFGNLNLEGNEKQPVRFVDLEEVGKESLPLGASEVQTIQIEPVDTEPLRQEVRSFTNQYLVLWTILSFGWFYALNNR